ncbi:hypothetical protein ACJIZ3_015943 [Penstemon smallii]|uniref:C2 domain-containing protein n=1 Tax=Penstemon smallii TaxID=265156 RepID=A0ABD3RP19_9LAMI
MEYRPLKIMVISAEGLKDKSLFSKMDVYAIVSIAGYPQSMKKTFVDKDCGTKPKWNHRMEFVIDEPYLTKPGLSLLFEIKAESSIRSDKEIGSVTVPIHELFQGNSSNEDRVVEYQVITPSGKPKGTLKISYNFGEKFTETKKQATESSTAYSNKHSDEPVTAYPAAAHPYPGMGYPPQYPAQAGYGGYPPPQSSGYGYQQPPPGYGYLPAAAAGYGAYPGAQKPKKNKMGMGSGLGMGLGAGLLGGLLVGEMASDIGDASSYADGYGDAMGDMGGGFDF